MGFEEINEQLEQVFDYALSDCEFESFHNASKYSQETLYEEVNFIVHPGWTAKNHHKDWEDEDRKEIFLQEFYSEYMEELGEIVQESGPEKPLHIIYSKGGKSHARTIVEQFGGAEVIKYTESLEDSGEVPESNFYEVLETLEKTHPDAKINVHGEIQGRCRSVFQEQLNENTMEDAEIRAGVTFPPKPTWNYAFKV